MAESERVVVLTVTITSMAGRGSAHDERDELTHGGGTGATQQLIQVASKNGWQRQKEMNEKVATNLQRIIAALEDAEEGSDHDA